MQKSPNFESVITQKCPLLRNAVSANKQGVTAQTKTKVQHSKLHVCYIHKTLIRQTRCIANKMQMKLIW